MFAELVKKTNPIGVLLLIAISKGRVGAKEVYRIDEPHSLPFLIATSKGRAAQRKFMRETNPIAFRF